MDTETKKKHLASYVALRTKVENMEDRLARLRSDEELPAMRMGDGSKHTGGSGDRNARATIRRMEWEEKNGPQIREARRKMAVIENAVDALDDPLEQTVLRLRYLDSDNSRLVKWQKVAAGIYGDDDEKDVRAAQRLHDIAVKNINLEELEE